MEIRLNGNNVRLPADISTIQQLLRHYQLEDRMVIVEVNRQIAQKEQYSSLPIHDGDAVELIHFVGGG